MVGISWLPELLYNDAALAVRSIQHYVRNSLWAVRSPHERRKLFLLEIKFETLFCLLLFLYL